VSNLSDLLPAGAAAKQLTFTDSGSGITSKKAVILNSDGTVSGVSSSAAALGTQQAVDGTSRTTGSNVSGACYSIAEDTWVYSWTDTASGGYPYAVAISFSGSSITVGTPVVVQSQPLCTFHKCAYEPTTEKIYFVWKTNSPGSGDYFVRGEWWSLSGTTLSTGNSVNTLFGNQPVSNYYEGDVCAIGNGKVAITWGESNGHVTGSGVQIVDLTGVPGSTPTIGTAVSAWSQQGTCCRIASGNADELVFQGGNATQIAFTACTISGTTITAGTATVYSGQSQQNNIDSGYWFGFTSPASTYVAVYQDPGAALGTLVGRVITVSGTTLTMNSAASLSADPMDSSGSPVGMAWGGSATEAFICYRKNSSPNNGEVTPISYSGTTVSDGTPISIGNSQYPSGAITFDSTESKIGIGYYDGSNSDAATVNSVTPFSTNLTAQAFVGVADSAISASAAGSVIVQGGTVTGVNSGQGFTVGTPSAFGGGVAISYPAMAYDTVHDKMVIAYQDQNNSSYGTAVVATISGSSISYGTPVVFESAGTEHIDVCFDPDQERVIIAYRDSPNSDYGTVIAGEVSGTSITFGSPVVYSSATTQNVNCVYDTSNDKVVIVYYDVSNTQLNAVVGTVSGSSISLGTPTTIVANNTSSGVKAVFDSTANKVVVVYCNVTNGDSDGVVGTVSGTSISFGSIVQFEAAIASPLTAAYDSSADKTLVVYGDAGNSDYGTSVVASVSGTSISFTSPSVFETSQPGVVKSVYDATAQQTVIAYQDYSASYIGVARAVSISGTTATFSGKTTLVDPNPAPFNLGYDSDNGKTIFAFYETTGQALVTSFGDLPLTTGTKYYVTTSGGFSSSADTPSVNAGLAISTTSLLLNGDS